MNISTKAKAPNSEMPTNRFVLFCCMLMNPPCRLSQRWVPSNQKKTLFLLSSNGHVKIEPLKLQSKETPSSSIQTVLSVLELHQFSPQRNIARSWTITTGREFHPALKTNLIYICYIQTISDARPDVKQIITVSR